MNIIELAKQAGFQDADWNYIKGLAKFAALVAAHEREECVKVARQISDIYRWHCYGNEVDTADEIAEAIRARGTT